MSLKRQNNSKGTVVPTEGPLEKDHLVVPQKNPKKNVNVITGFINKAAETTKNIFSDSKKKEKHQTVENAEPMSPGRFGDVSPMLSLSHSNKDHAQLLKDEDELRLMDDELSRIIFQTKEVDLKGGNANGKKNEKLDADVFKDGFEMTAKDNNGRIILHRAALQQRNDTIEQMLENLKDLDDDKIQEITEQLDNYKNTPLGLSCVYGAPEKRVDKKEVVKLLLSRGKANPNVCNPYSMWTPMHWAARYGDHEIIDILLQYNAKEYLPDKKGFYPIDYAGFFGNVEVVQKLINKALSRISMLSRDMMPEHWNHLLKTNMDKDRKYVLVKRYHYDHPILMFNPQYHTSILYWASYFNEIEPSVLDQILKYLQAYPEGPVAIHSWRTPCHAAAQVGNSDKLKKLLTDIRRRYKDDNKEDYQKYQPCPDFQSKWNQLLHIKKYAKIKKFQDQVFYKKLIGYRETKKFKFDFEDKFQNTPLHLASQNGKEQCAQMLIQEYGCSLDIRNIEGWMPKDLTQHDPIKKVYKKFYKKLNSILNETVAGTEDDLERLASLGDEENIRANMNNFDKSKLQQDLIKCREYLPKVPILAMKVNTKETLILNRMIDVLKNSHFNVYLFGAIDPQYHYICLDLEQSKLELIAHQIKLKMKLSDVDDKNEFDMNKKIKYEPFRSKDIQNIMLTEVRRVINTQQLQQKGILISIILMHDFYGIHELKTKWEQRTPKYIPMPYPIIKQFYKEGINLKFQELSSIKNYFGEKLGFWFAWLSFYATWLMIPGFLGLIITIYQIKTGYDTVFTGMYAIGVSLWVTLFIERWKRKSSEIASKWGIWESEDSGERQIRDQFQGDEVFSHVNHQVNIQKRSYKNVLSYIYSIPIFIIMIGICIFVFFYTKAYKDNNIGGKRMTPSLEKALTDMIIDQKAFLNSTNVINNNSSSQSNAVDPPANETSSGGNQTIPIDGNNNTNSSSDTNSSSSTNSSTLLLDETYDSVPQDFMMEHIERLVDYQNNKDYSVKSNKDNIIQILAGVINGLAIAIVNFIYQWFAQNSVKTENHKYPDTYETSLVYKLFIFKFVNTNLQLFYTAFIDKDYESLYNLIVGMTIQKSIQIFMLQGALKFAIFWYKKRAYFKTIKKLALEQKRQHDNFIDNQLEGESKKFINDQILEHKKKATVLYSAINEDGTNPGYQRLVFNTENNIEEQQILVDAVEINNLMGEKTEIVEINEISETFIFFGLATLYAAACPVVTFLVMLHTVGSIKCDLWLRYTLTRRPLQEVRSNIGPWIKIAEFMAIITVITNCLLLYYASPRFKTFFKTNFSMRDDINILWVILIIEHVLIVLKFFLQAVILDKPGWVDKAQRKIKYENEKQQKEESERAEKKRNELNQEQLKQYKNKNQQFFAKLTEKIKKMKSDIISMNSKNKSPSPSSVKSHKDILNLSLIDVKPQDVKLVDFLGLRAEEWFGVARQKELDKALNRNIQMRLYRLTFNSIEKEILGKRISRLYDTKKQVVQINCAECSQTQAVIECIDCGDHFCKECCEQFHQSSQLFANHNMINVPTEAPQGFQMFGKVTQKLDTKMQNYFNQQVNSSMVVPLWKKFEYFNFPLQQGSDLYTFVQRHFAYLRQQYIEKNFITGIDTIDFKSLFVDGQYDILTDKQAAILQIKNAKQYGDKVLEPQSDKFNDEELFYMNRIAFYLFRYKGEHLTFVNFINRLDIIQNETFQKKLTLWLSILEEHESDSITREQMSKIFRIAYIQDANQKLTDEDILKMMYAEEQSLKISQILDVVEKNQNLSAFMRCMLQDSSKL